MKRKTIIKIIKFTIVALIFFFIIRYLYLNINAVDISNIHFNLYFLFLSVALYIIHITCNAAIWYCITKQNACNIGFFESLKVRIYSDFGKYIPGKVFAYGMLFYSYDKKGISTKKIMICSFQEFIIGVLAAIIIALISIYFSNIAILNKYNPVFLGLAIICLIAVHPGILKFFANKLLKLFKREPITLTTSYGQIFIILILFFANWLIFGWAFYFFINSFYTYPVSEYFYTTGAFSIAGLIGFAAIFAPAGLGVREGVLVITLGYIFTTTIASLISLISRIWMTLCELLLFAIVFMFNYFYNKTVFKK